MDEGRFLQLVREARGAVGRLPEGWGGAVTGQVLRLAAAQQNLVSTQLRSLSLAFVLVFLAVFVGLRSWRLTLVAIPPNLLPVAVTFASMAWIGIPLDAATVMVASVALGVAVDNSLHYLIEVSRERAAGSDPVGAARGALVMVAPTIAVATMAAFTGFASLVVSSFLPIRYYGGLSAILMVVALASDLLVTPAILAAAVSWAPRGPEDPP
jgi:predicted RND superfamily exporter protein